MQVLVSLSLLAVLILQICFLYPPSFFTNLTTTRPFFLFSLHFSLFSCCASFLGSICVVYELPFPRTTVQRVPGDFERATRSKCSRLIYRLLR